MYPAKTGSELLSQIVCLHNLSLDLSADLTKLTRDFLSEALDSALDQIKTEAASKVALN